MNETNGNGKPTPKKKATTAKPRKRAKYKRKTVAEGRQTRAKTAKGKATPQKHATVAEVEDRVMQTMMLVVQGETTAGIKEFFRTVHDISWSHALRYLRIARDRLRDENGLTDEFTLEDMEVQHYAISMRKFRECEDDKDQLAALKHAGSIYGVQAPTKIAPTTPDGKHSYSPVKEALRLLSVPELEVLQKVRDRIDSTQIPPGSRTKRSVN